MSKIKKSKGYNPFDLFLWKETKKLAKISIVYRKQKRSVSNEKRTESGYG